MLRAAKGPDDERRVVFAGISNWREMQQIHNLGYGNSNKLCYRLDMIAKLVVAKENGDEVADEWIRVNSQKFRCRPAAHQPTHLDIPSRSLFQRIGVVLLHDSFTELHAQRLSHTATVFSTFKETAANTSHSTDWNSLKVVSVHIKSNFSEILIY